LKLPLFCNNHNTSAGYGIIFSLWRPTPWSYFWSSAPHTLKLKYLKKLKTPKNLKTKKLNAFLKT